MNDFTVAAFKNWRSTIAAVISAVAGYVVYSPEDFAQWPIVINVSKYIMLGGLAAFGIFARDSATSKTKEQKAALAEKNNSSGVEKQ